MGRISTIERSLVRIHSLLYHPLLILHQWLQKIRCRMWMPLLALTALALMPAAYGQGKNNDVIWRSDVIWCRPRSPYEAIYSRRFVKSLVQNLIIRSINTVCIRRYSNALHSVRDVRDVWMSVCDVVMA